MRYFWSIVAFFLIDVTPAMASGQLTEASWTDFKFRVINFILFAGILVWLLRKKIKEYYAGRKEKIANELRDMEAAKIEAEKSLAEVEKRIASLEIEAQEILDEYRRQGESIQATIIARAEETARQITEQAQFTVENEAKMAAENLRFAVADMVVEATEQVLKSQLGPEEHEKLIDKYLNKVVLN